MSLEAIPQQDLFAQPAHEPVPSSTILLQIASQLVSIHDPEALYRAIPQKIAEALPSIDASILWLYSPQQSTLQVGASHGLESQSNPAFLRQIRLRHGEGLPGSILQRSDPLWVDGRSRYRELSGPYNQRNQEGLRQLFDLIPRDMSAVLLPLRAGADVMGVLELLSLNHRPPFGSGDFPTLQLFANIVASAIHSAQIYVQMKTDQRRLESFGAISTAVSSASDLDELVSNTLDVLMGVVQANAGMLLLYNPSRSSLTLGAQRHMPASYAQHHEEIGVADAACAEAVRYGQPISRPLLPDEQALIDDGMASCIYLPLLAGGTVAGVACMYGVGNLYEQIDTRVLMMIGSLVGFAIANVKLYTYSEVERQRLAAVIGGIAEGVALCDGEGRLILANQTAMDLLSLEHVPFGQQVSEMPDFYGIRRLNGDPLPVEEHPLAKALSGEIFHDYRVFQRGASGRDTVMSFSGGPVNQDDLTQGAVVVFRDVTASQKVERAKDDFLAVAAHELRSPLAAVRSYTDLLVRREQKRDEDSPDLRGLTILAQQVTHMLRMVDNLLDVSRLDADQVSLQIQQANLASLVQQVIEQQRPSAGERTLNLEIKQPDLTIACDSLRIRQVLTNLVSNAIRYSANETSISVTLAQDRVADVLARHPDALALRHADGGLAMADDLALIAVEDQGVGISEEQRATLFRRYSRGRERRGEGLGLGLYLSREFVQRHGGLLWVESELGRGSTFYVALPMEQPDEGF